MVHMPHLDLHNYCLLLIKMGVPTKETKGELRLYSMIAPFDTFEISCI